jgi:hypothetical protein
MPDVITHLDDGSLWLAAVVSGLVALGWLVRKAWRGYRKLDDFLRKADVILDIASYELQHNGGGSIKDGASQIPGLVRDVAELKAGARKLEAGAGVIAKRAAEFRAALDAHVEQARDIHDEQAAAIASLAEALPVVARSTPHPDDAADVGP